jgi:LPS-assembly protein
MVRVVFLVLGLSTVLVAEGNESNITTPPKLLKIKASSIKSNQGVVQVPEDALIHYKGALVRADETRYDTKSKVLKLKGNVQAIGYRGIKEYAQEVEVETQQDKAKFKKAFLVNENDIWMYADDMNKTQGTYTASRSTLSSCDVRNPLWRMEFSDSEYHSIEEYVELYNATLYMHSVPIFYLPYWYFSTNNERASGLLSPKIGYSEHDGFFYEQPIFWAINRSMDLEVVPQLRSKRSVGAYSTFRFADSPSSRGLLRAGYFQDKKSYNPQQEEHYGVEFKYSSPDFWLTKPEGYSDGLYVNLLYLNDVEYINLKRSGVEYFGVNPIQSSKLNYYLHNDDYYYGLNAKYFIDTRKADNDETLQVLPALQWHKYLQSFLIDNLTYSVDAQVRNFDRSKGTTLRQAEFSIPIEYSTTLLDDYVHLTLREKLYYNKYFFGNGSFEETQFEYYNSIHDASIYTDLVKSYGDYTHVLQPSIAYEHPGFESEGPIDYELLQDDQRALFSVGLPERNFKLGLKQYLYDDDKLIFSQRIDQVYYPGAESEWSDIRNEMRSYWRKWTFYNRMMYSFDFDKIRESATSISLSKQDYSIRMGHSYLHYLETPARKKINMLSLYANYRWNSRLNLSTGLSYNAEEKSKEQARFNIGYHRDCWGIDFSFIKDLRPTIQNLADVKQTYYYFQIHFKPFGSIGNR